MSVYTRDTELRHVKPNDIYKLGVILNEDNCWLKLLELIPKGIDNHAFTQQDMTAIHQYLDNLISTCGRKYTNDHVHLLEDAVKRPGETRLLAQILFDEWSISGRKRERPTIGVLLHLLVKAELFRAADFVAENLLKEPPPVRPANGPGSKVDTTLPSEVFEDIEDMVYDSNYYPTTATLNSHQNNSNNDNNMDFYVKYCGHLDREKSMLNRNDDRIETEAPKPPPRPKKLARVQQAVNGEINSQQEDVLLSSSAIETNVCDEQNLPKFSALLSSIKNESNNSLAMDSERPVGAAISNTTMAAQASGMTSETRTITNNSTETDLHLKNDEVSFPLLSILIKPVKQPTQSKLDTQSNMSNCNESEDFSSNLQSSVPLPILSALNINEGHGAESSRFEQKSLINFDSAISGQSDNNSRVYAEDIELTDISTNSKHLSKSQQQQQRPEHFSISQTTEEEFSIHGSVAQEINYKIDSNEVKSEIVTDGSSNGDDNVEKDDDEDELIPNLSFFGQGSSNNDSSLTTVTGTSGDSSFDLSLNDCSSNSLDNIPTVSTTKP